MQGSGTVERNTLENGLGCEQQQAILQLQQCKYDSVLEVNRACFQHQYVPLNMPRPADEPKDHRNLPACNTRLLLLKYECTEKRIRPPTFFWLSQCKGEQQQAERQPCGDIAAQRKRSMQHTGKGKAGGRRPPVWWAAWACRVPSSRKQDKQDIRLRLKGLREGFRATGDLAGLRLRDLVGSLL